MLAKVIRDAAEPLAPVEWPVARVSAVDQDAVNWATQGDRSDVAQLRAEIASLKAQLEMTHASAERRVQEALASARIETDESARQAVEKQLESELSKLRGMIRDLAASGPKLRRNTEEELVRLSIAVARRILHRELTIDPDALIGLVKAAFDRLGQREVQQLRTDPGSVTMVRKLVEGLDLARTVKVIGDPSLKAGSLLIETTRGELDASIETQLNEIQRGFIDIVHHS
jgi:flagellar assembly protein FliH